MNPSPWANKSVAPLQAAGLLVRIEETPNGAVGVHQLHGTAFFISDDGFFLTAAHVVEDHPPIEPKLAVMIIGGAGVSVMPVAMVIRHPPADVALGIANISPAAPTRPRPMTLSRRRLEPGEWVAILGYPKSLSEHALSDEGVALTSFTVTPDFYEGEVLEHHPGGVGLAKWPAYSTGIVPPPGSGLADLGGASGGPLVHCGTVFVHGVACSASEQYTLCTDIETVLDWDVFEDAGEGSVTVRDFAVRRPGVIRIAE